MSKNYDGWAVWDAYPKKWVIFCSTRREARQKAVEYSESVGDLLRDDSPPKVWDDIANGFGYRCVKVKITEVKA